MLISIPGTNPAVLQITGEAQVVRKALFQIAARIHDNPSRSQHMLLSATPDAVYPSGGSRMGPTASTPIMGLSPHMDPYSGYKGEGKEWSHSFYMAPRDDFYAKEFSLRMICSTANIGGVIGKSGVIINKIRQDSRASIKVDSSAIAGDDCIISISAKEVNYPLFVVLFGEGIGRGKFFLKILVGLFFFPSLQNKTHKTQP